MQVELSMGVLADWSLSLISVWVLGAVLAFIYERLTFPVGATVGVPSLKKDIKSAVAWPILIIAILILLLSDFGRRHIDK
jgi:hypothetical protein